MHSSEKRKTAVLTMVTIIIIIAKINRIRSKSKILIQGPGLSAFIKMNDKGSGKAYTETWGLPFTISR